MTTLPAKVGFSKHSLKRIRQRGLDHRQITKMMYTLPYREGMHQWDAPGTDLRLIFSDELRRRTVITAIRIDGRRREMNGLIY